ncbi:transposase [Lacticaseibacillus sp. GG6-2]
MGRKGSRYSAKEKRFYISLVKNGMAANTIRKKYGVHDSQIAQWVERYDAGGVAALSRRLHQAYSEELMLEVVQAYLAGGMAYSQLARQYNISNGAVIYQWVKRKTTQIERIEIAPWVISAHGARDKR